MPWLMRAAAAASGMLASIVAFTRLPMAVTIVILRALGGGGKRISPHDADPAGSRVVGLVMMPPHFTVPHGRQWLRLAGCGLAAALKGSPPRTAA